MRYSRKIFNLTPLGKADNEVQSFLEKRLAEHQMKRYRKALAHYRYMKMVHAGLKILFYAGLITSAAATFGLRTPVLIVEQVATYIGTGVIFVLYAFTGYVTMIRRESYHVQREILISEAAAQDLD